MLNTDTLRPKLKRVLWLLKTLLVVLVSFLKDAT